MAVEEPEEMLKGKCPFCKIIFVYPMKDRVNVVLFDNWRKYHYCKEAREYDRKKEESEGSNQSVS